MPTKQTETNTNKETITEPNSYALAILFAMNRLGRHIYSGTVPASVVAKRRANNKTARAQRKINRR